MSRQLRQFTPITPGKVGIYLCGATVQSAPHIGHVRSAVVFDVLRRWLIAQGNDVLFIRNVTDIDDKILTKARQAGRPWWEWAAHNEYLFNQAYDQLGVLPPSAAPHATGYMTQMFTYMQRLIDKGHAYAEQGDVYFSVASFPEYGRLSRQKIDHVQQGETPGPGKRDPRDFALWKAAKPGEPSWPSPWGPGRPGWHLECSAMATDLLGPQFDIHCGGIDLLFPHHENEIAQSVCAGDEFANYWLHNGWITMGGEKMSKSLGNVVSIPNLLTSVRPIELRYYLGMTHYRSTQEYSQGALAEAVVALRRIENVLLHAHKQYGSVEIGERPQEFDESIDNDLGVPEALAIIHGFVRQTNILLINNNPQGQQSAGQLRAMLAILGIDPLSEQWVNQQGHREEDHAVAVMVKAILAQRDQARASKDWATSDKLRDILTDAGITIADSPEGTRWWLEPGESKQGEK